MQNNSTKEQDLPDLIFRIQERLNSLEKKIDILVNRTLPKPSQAKPFSKPLPQFTNNFAKASMRQNSHFSRDTYSDNRSRERVMHKTICADCKNECEVPFVPSGNRPVYCQECFSRRKNNNSFRPNIASKPKQTFTAHLDSFKRLQVADKKNSPAKKKFLEKKKTVFKKKRRAR